MIVLKETIGFGEFLYITIWKMTAFAKKTRSRKPHLLMFVSENKVYKKPIYLEKNIVKLL